MCIRDRHWMEYISGASPKNPSGDAYYFRMQYPDDYKSNDTRIVKFEKNHFQFLEYRFVGLFPLSLNSTKVSYQSSTVLKATASFSYDRYICGESSSLARALGLDLNNKSGSGASGTGAYSYNDDTFLNQIITQNSFALLNDGTQAQRFGNNVNISDNPNKEKGAMFITKQVVSQYQR